MNDALPKPEEDGSIGSALRKLLKYPAIIFGYTAGKSAVSRGVANGVRGVYEKMYKASTHWAPFAHCILSIRVRVPVFIARQLVKRLILKMPKRRTTTHKMGSQWNESYAPLLG